MVQSLRIYETQCTDPYVNLAVEKYLLEHVSQGQCILYLWQNQNTVVIGRGQNAWAECRTSLLEQEGGKLARRLSGGGAVFHDLGNLNFTFLTTEDNYDLNRQLSVIQTACRLLGIDAVPSGRNDLLVNGAKFSGNAFYHSQGKAYHHGTLLINADMDKLSRYLSPSKAKLEAKGVQSVRSRVINLSQIVPGLTCDSMRLAMKEAFARVYGLFPTPFVPDSNFQESVCADAEINSSWQWLYGKQLPFSFQCENRFSWGSIQLQLDVRSGIVQAAKAYSDAMDWSLAPTLEQALTGIPFSLREFQEAICAAQLQGDIVKDLQKFFKELIL